MAFGRRRPKSRLEVLLWRRLTGHSTASATAIATLAAAAAAAAAEPAAAAAATRCATGPPAATDALRCKKTSRVARVRWPDVR